MKTVCHIYNSYGQARPAVNALEAAGIPARDISVVVSGRADAGGGAADEASPASACASIGALAGVGAGILAGLGLIAIPGLGPVVATGWMATAAVGAVTGLVAGAAAGGIIGALRAAGQSARRGDAFSGPVGRGRALVTARVAEDHEDRARAIFAKHDPVASGARRMDDEPAGWAALEPKAPADPSTAAAIDRIRHKGFL